VVRLTGRFPNAAQDAIPSCTIVPNLAREVALTLVALALEVGLGRAYHARTSEVAFHLPQQTLAAALWPDAAPETGRKRVQRALRRLASLGLLSYRGRVGNARDRVTGKSLGWKDGTVTLVRLTPGQARALTREDLVHALADPGSLPFYASLL